MPHGLLETINDISASLATLALQVRQEALAGLGSRHKIAENVLLPVLRRVYQAPNLSNTNAQRANFPGIDLYDPTSGLGVQVTSEVAAAKIKDTIDTLVAQSIPLKRLVVALVAETAPAYQRRPREQWVTATQGRFAFSPDDDVIPFERLLSLIQRLLPEETAAIAAELRALVRGSHSIQLLPHLLRQVNGQLAEEQRIARYIPDVFVETQDTKYHARCFAHPGLFARRIAEWFERAPLAGLNRLASMSGVPALATPSPSALAASDSPAIAASAARPLMAEIDSLDATLGTYYDLGREGGADVPRDQNRAHVLAETRYYIEMNAGSMRYRMRDRRTELECVAARIFLLTGPAGQGKTNFLCDFTEHFLLRHDIPCAYVTARQLGRAPQQPLDEVLRQLILPAAVASLDEGLAALAPECAERRTPFVLVIDGLNEHPNVRTFAGQLERLLEVLIRHEHVRVLLTCRSEFLEQRFGQLISGPLATVLRVSRPLGQRFDDEQFRELLVRYFRFFKVRPSRVAPRVKELLQRDVLLLRFFCEAYGARGRDASYDPPFVGGIYRDEIFRRYVEDKLGRAQRTLDDDQTLFRPLARRSEIRSVLSLVAAHMLETGHFSDVPRNVVPPALDAELTALLDEELVLRHDLGSAQSVLDEPLEVLNFTFDEMRDFLLAQHLLGVWGRDSQEFERLLAAQQPSEAQSVEGLQRFLFYASRVPGNSAFLESYCAHPWYGAVYDSEIFAIPPTHLTEDDRRIATEALAAGGSHAQYFARRLSLAWSPSHSPVLNLSLLLSHASSADPAFFTDVFAPAFGTRYYGEDSLAESFCRFLERDILPVFAPEEDQPYESVFQLLVLLLPIHAGPTLESPAVKVFREVHEAHPEFAIELLRKALADGLQWPRAFVWRLLGEFPSSSEADDALRKAAESDAADATASDELRREAARFLARVSSLPSSP